MVRAMTAPLTGARAPGGALACARKHARVSKRVSKRRGRVHPADDSVASPCGRSVWRCDCIIRYQIWDAARQCKCGAPGFVGHVSFLSHQGDPFGNTLFVKTVAAVAAPADEGLRITILDTTLTRLIT